MYSFLCCSEFQSLPAFIQDILQVWTGYSPGLYTRYPKLLGFEFGARREQAYLCQHSAWGCILGITTFASTQHDLHVLMQQGGWAAGSWAVQIHSYTVWEKLLQRCLLAIFPLWTFVFHEHISVIWSRCPNRGRKMLSAESIARRTNLLIRRQHSARYHASILLPGTFFFLLFCYHKISSTCDFFYHWVCTSQTGKNEWGQNSNFGPLVIIAVKAKEAWNLL